MKDTHGRDALQQQEILFSLVMGAIGLLCVGNPRISPGILWAFGAMLAFNLAAHRAMRPGAGPAPALLSLGANVALGAAVVALSGGAESSFWPLFLLPVFTASLHLEGRHAAGAWAAAAGFLAYFYLEGMWEGRRWDVCEYLIKAGVLGMAAAVTGRLAARERRQRQAFCAARERIDSLARALERRTAEELLALRRQSLGAVVPGIVHALQNPLAVVLGTLELLLQETPPGALREDLERVQAAARRCAQVGEDLLQLAHSKAAVEAR
jgi:signal transduction histidine kinase